MSNKFEQLLELLINEENDKAEQLFHEIVVEKSRDIYEGLAETTEESKDETVEETKKETKEESKDEETVGEQVELADESKDETVEEESIEEVGGDATDELIKDVSAEEEGEMGAGEEGDMEAGEEGEEEMEDRVVDLEDALDELKAEFEKMMSGMDKDGDGDHDMEDHEKEESLAPTEAEMPFEAMHDGKKKEKMDEYKIQKSADNADHADGKKSPVNDAGTKMGHGGKNIAQGSAEEKGRTAPTAEKIIGDVANTAGKDKLSMKPAPKAVTADQADNKKSPVASK
jgi:hypothetical protein